MATHLFPNQRSRFQASRPSGVPPKGRLGASRGELLYLLIGLIVFAAIAVGFWFEAMR